MKNRKFSKTAALARFLNCKITCVKKTKWESAMRNNEEYLILSDSEADQKAADYIKETVWAFNYDFLCQHSQAIKEMGVECFKAMQEKCEKANRGILAMIDDVDDFVKNAICTDGRGHFLASYDAKENEQDGYYIYRIN